KENNGTPFVGWVWPGQTLFPDFSIPEAREWWGEKHKVLFDAGVQGIWNDMNEIAYNTNLLRPASVKNVVFHDNGRKTPYHGLHNIYANYEAMGTRIGFEKHRPNKRPFILSRSGFAGIQKYAAVWTGDNWSTWEHLRLSIWMISNLGISGVPFVGADIGGFTHIFPSFPPITLRKGELYARWIELGVFYPFCRGHSSKYGISTYANEPWRYGKKVEEIAKKYISLRYTLLPLIYDAFVETSLTGRPIAAPLLFDFPKDRRSIECEDEFIFAKYLLVAPVFKKGARKHQVYLPPGKWVDFWNYCIYEGPTEVCVDAPLDIIPLFIRGGSVLIMGPPRNHVSEKPLSPLEIRIFALECVEHVHYEDDGETFNYKKGEELQMPIKVTRTNHEVTIIIDKRVGSYLPPKRKILLKAYTEFKPESITLNGVKVQAKLDKKGDLHETVLEFADDGEKKEIILS
ncbi:MAG: glycoside hydrolase family 31 protein, partial [Candidatus Korarchaeota archaeon]